MTPNQWFLFTRRGPKNDAPAAMFFNTLVNLPEDVLGNVQRKTIVNLNKIMYETAKHFLKKQVIFKILTNLTL